MNNTTSCRYWDGKARVGPLFGRPLIRGSACPTALVARGILVEGRTPWMRDEAEWLTRTWYERYVRILDLDDEHFIVVVSWFRPRLSYHSVHS